MTVFAAWENRIAKLERGALVAQAMADVAIGAADERRRQLWVKVLVVLVIVKARLADVRFVAFDTCLILNRKDDHGGLARKPSVMLERVPRRQ